MSDQPPDETPVKPVQTAPADEPEADRDVISDPNLGTAEDEETGADWSSEGGATPSGPATHSETETD